MLMRKLLEARERNSPRGVKETLGRDHASLRTVQTRKPCNSRGTAQSTAEGLASVRADN